MKKILLLSGLLAMMIQVQSQQVKSTGNLSFREGEKLKFKVYYDSRLTGKVNAGHATLEVMKENKTVLDRPVYHVVGEGKSHGAFDWFYKVRDRFESYIDKETLQSLYFVRRTREGDYKKDDEIIFDRQTNTATSRKRKTKLLPGTQDLVSSLYYARNLNLEEAKIGQNFPLNFFLNDSVYVSIIQYLGKESIKVGSGHFNCLKFKPMVATGKVFSEPYPMTVWVTDDENHIPVLVQSAVVIGSINMELESWSGIAYPLSSKVK